MKKIVVLIFTLINVAVFAQSTDGLNLNITVVNPDTIPEVGAKVELTVADKMTQETVNDEGKVTFKIPQGSTFAIKIRQYDTVFDFGEITLDSTKLYNEINYGLTIQHTTHFIKTYELNIHFDSNQSAIRKEDYPIMGQLVDTLMKNSSMQIEIAAHTDSDGADDFNQLLSQRRASSVKKFLISKGIDEMRMTAKGYGEKQPVADNATEKGKAANRRTEIRVISE